MAPTVALLIGSYANLMLVIASLLYIIHAVGHFKNIGWLATGCAGLGVLGLSVSILFQWLHPATMTDAVDLSFILGLFCAITVIIYLFMEKWYDARTAGAFVMPIVATAAIFQTLGGTTETITASHTWQILQNAGTHLYVLCSFVSVCAFIWAAILSVIYLWHNHVRSYMFARQTSDWIERRMTRAIALGFMAFTLAQIMEDRFSKLFFVDDWNRHLHSLSMIFVWLFYFLFILLHRQFQQRGRFMAWYAITGLILYVLLLPELHTGWPLEN